MATQYEKEFKSMIVGLLQSGQKTTDVSKEYGLGERMIRRWKSEASGDREAFTGRGVKSMSPEEKELSRLKKELREVTMERDILKKAVAIFSKTAG